MVILQVTLSRILVQMFGPRRHRSQLAEGPGSRPPTRSARLAWTRAPARRARRPRSGTRRLGRRRRTRSRPDALPAGAAVGRLGARDRARRSARAATSGASACSPRRAGRPTPARGGTSARSCSPAPPDRTSLTDSGVALPAVRRAGRRARRGQRRSRCTSPTAARSSRAGSAGRRSRVSVGANGDERYGSCRRAARRAAKLADGWLPILETRYVDGARRPLPARSRSRRAAARRGLTSFVRLTADTSAAARRRARDRALPRRGRSRVPVRGSRAPSPSRGRSATQRAGLGDDAPSYDAARAAASSRYWQTPARRGDDRRRARAAASLDAARALLVQDLLLTWRYSIGNAVRAVLVPRGRRRRAGARRAGLRGRRARDPAHLAHAARDAAYPNWKMGEKLLGVATHFRLFRDRAVPRARDARAARLRRDARPPDRREPDGPARPRALLVRHPRPGLRAALAGRRLGRAARDGRRVGADRPGRARRDAAARSPRRLERRPAPGRARVAAPAARRLAASSRFGCSTTRQPYDSLSRRARAATGTSSCPTRSRRGSSRRSRRRRRLALHAAARLAPARARPRRRVRAVRPRRAVPRLGHRPGLRHQRLALPRRPRRGRPARAEPLRPARCRDDARHVRRRRGRERGAACPARASARCTCRRTAPPTRRSSRRCGCCSCTRRRDARARLLDAARVARRRQAHRRRRTRRPASGRSRSRSRRTTRSADVTVDASRPRDAAHADAAPAPPGRQAHRVRHARRPAVPQFRREHRHDRSLRPHRHAAPPGSLSASVA